MKIQKIHLDDIVRCYCAGHIDIGNETYALLASENPTSPCRAYPLSDISKSEKVWDDRGGCMSIIPIPNKEAEFLAINEFYLKISPSKAKLVHGKRVDGQWIIEDILNLPFLHRFDIYNVNGNNYLICATIARDKDNKEDWSKPGQVYGALLPDDLSQPIELIELLDGCYRNHGYTKGIYEGKTCGFFGSDQGIYRIIPPYDGKWSVEKIHEGNVSEIAFSDLDGDGIEEMMTIEPFHGNNVKIYKNVDGTYKEVYQYPNKIDFAHALVGTTLCGVNSFVVGIRRVNAELFYVQHVNGKYEVTIIESGVGPANLDVIHAKECDYIVAANHTKNEAALYKLTK